LIKRLKYVIEIKVENTWQNLIKLCQIMLILAKLCYLSKFDKIKLFRQNLAKLGHLNLSRKKLVKFGWIGLLRKNIKTRLGYLLN